MGVWVVGTGVAVGVGVAGEAGVWVHPAASRHANTTPKIKIRLVTFIMYTYMHPPYNILLDTPGIGL
jgi:hypothetical protein